jgi:hypothetical protein
MTTKKNVGKPAAQKKAPAVAAKKDAKQARTPVKAAKPAAAKAPAKVAKVSPGKAEAPPKAAKPKAPAKAPPKAPAKAAKAPAKAAKAPAKPAKTAKAAAKPSTPAPAPTSAPATPTLADQILASETPAPQIAELGAALLDGAGGPKATLAAKTLGDIAGRRIELLTPQVDKFAKTIASKNKHVAQAAADALPGLARVAPARVARHLELLRASFAEASLTGKDGLVRTFAALCTASVAYQKRLEPVLTTALGEAEGKVLLRWSQVVLPALKGEPHARARAVVEERLDRIPRAYAQQIADFLGIKLRTRYR